MRILLKKCPEHFGHREVDFNIGDIGKGSLQFLLPQGGGPGSAARTESRFAPVIDNFPLSARREHFSTQSKGSTVYDLPEILADILRYPIMIPVCDRVLQYLL